MKKLVFSICIAVSLSACSAGYVSFPVSEEQQEKLPEDIEVIRLNRENIKSYATPESAPATNFVPESQVWNYKVGVGDVLSVAVFDHPELALPATTGNSEDVPGFRVQANGTFFYPYVGDVQASGLTPELIRRDLTAKISEYIPDPQLQVRVAEYNSQSAIVSGEVETPKSQMLNSTPLTVLAAINAAGGLTEIGDLSRVKLRRKGKTYNINLERFLSGSGGKHNPIVINGDVITVPPRPAKEAYVLGQVVDPATIDLSKEPVNLTQAITKLGGLDEKRADARGVFVFRRSGEKTYVFQLAANSPTGLLMGTDFGLAHNDVVYVTRAPISQWNDIITQLLPTIGFGNTVNDF